VTVAVLAAGVAGVPAVASAAGGSTLYVDDLNKSCTDSGAGTATAPYCTIAAAAAVVDPGQTVQVISASWAPVTLKRSGTAAAPITFSGNTIGLGDSETIGISGTSPAPYGLVIDGASNVVVEGFAPVGTTSAVLVENSSNITLDQNVISSGITGISVTGSAGVTISRNFVRGTGNETTGIQIGSGSQHTTVTTNEIWTGAVTALRIDGAADTIVNSNTIVSPCGEGIVLSGASTGSTLENNIVDTAQQTIPESSCGSAPSGIEVAADAVSGTSADYNLIDPNSGGPLYSWNGTLYTTLSAFTTSTSQGSHDIAANPDLTTVFNMNGYYPEVGSPAIDSADANAPGEMSTDIVGNARQEDPDVANTGTGSGYYDRGAYELQAPLTHLTIAAAPETGGGPLDVTFAVSISNPWADLATYTIDFGYPAVSRVVTTRASTFTVNYTFRDYANNATDDAFNQMASVDVTDGSKRPDISAESVVRVGAGFTPVKPLRILDTRSAIGISTKTPIKSGSDVVLQVAGKDGVPATAEAIAANITAVTPTGGGYLTAYADGQSLPATSSLNYGPGQNVPNLVTTEITNGRIRIHVTGSGTVHLLVDLQGYYGDAGTGYTASGPVRVLDTRHAVGISTKTPLPAGGTITLSLAGQVPAGTTAVAMNLTETAATGNGVLTVYPAGSTMPTVSNLNYTTGQTLANEVIAPVANGKVEIHEAGAGSAHIIADLAGYYSSAGTDYFTPYAPLRVVDTRSNKGYAGRISASTTEQIVRQGLMYVGDAGVYNLTETQPTAGGYLTLFAGGASLPNASNINFTAGMTRANLVITPLNGMVSDDTLNVYDGQAGGTVQFILDLYGLFDPDSYGSGSEL
jgi:parallel beta-helix repeat protein